MEDRKFTKKWTRNSVVNILKKISDNNELDYYSESFLIELMSLINGDYYSSDYETMLNNVSTIEGVINDLEKIEEDTEVSIRGTISELDTLLRRNKYAIKEHEIAMKEAYFFKKEEKRKPMFYIFLGAPGTGKGTISNLLKQKYNFNHISTGDLFRNITKGDSNLSKKVKELIDGGNFIDDKTTTEVLINALEKIDLSSDTILDGYPRNLKQVELLEDYLQEKGINNYKVINLYLPKYLIIKRLSGRRICSTCGKTYNDNYNQPKVENTCDIDQGELITRADDNIDKIEYRLEIFEEQTKPVIDYYREQKKLKTVDTNANGQEIIRKILY